MNRLIYCSQAKGTLKFENVKAILKSAIHNNTKNKLTGVLLYNHNYFIQCLEGQRLELNQTFQKISKDSRHENVCLLNYQAIGARQFSEWSMGVASLIKVNIEVFKKYTKGEEFNPYEIASDMVPQFILEMSKVAKSFASTQQLEEATYPA